MKHNRGEISPSIIAGIITGILFTLIISSCFYTVTSGTKALVFRFGEIVEVVGEGLHFKIPMVDRAVKVDIRTQTAAATAQAGTFDLQSATTTVSLNYHFNPDLLKQTYSKFGIDGISERIVDPRIQDVVKAVVAKYSAENLLKKREEVKNEIAHGLTQAMVQYNLVVESIQVTNFSFSKSFNDAIEAKQTSEQYAKKAVNDLERIKVEAEQKIVGAKAEAETIRIQADAIRAQGGKEYVELKAIEKWDGKLSIYSGGAVPFLNLNK